MGADTPGQRGVQKAAEVWGKNEVRGKTEACGGSRYAAAKGERERRRRGGGAVENGGVRWRLCYSYENAKKRGHQVDAPMQY